MKIGIILGHEKTGGGGPHVVDCIRRTLSEEHEVVTYTFTKHDNSVTKNKSVVPLRFDRLIILQQCSGERVAGLACDCDLLVYPDFLIGIPDTKQPVIIYNHSGYRPHQKNEYRGIRKPYYDIFETRLQKMCRRVRDDKNVHIITNSQYTAGLVREDTGRESTVIYPDVDIEGFGVRDQRERSGVVSVGTFNKYKYYEIACDVMTCLESPYTIMGIIHDSKERAYHDMLRAKYPSVQLVSNVSVEEMKDRLWSAKVYLHARIEDFGISIVEAIAAGCVPVVPDAGGIRETVPVSDLRYTPNDLNAMREKVETALAGAYDHHLPFLQKHVERYDTSVFQKSFLDFVQAVCK